MPISDIRTHYLLFEAFELIGERLFGPQWTHNELNQPRAIPPDDMTKARAPYLKRLRVLESRIAKVEKRIARITDANEIALLTNMLREMNERRISIGIALNGLPEPGESHKYLYANYQRKQRAEETLVAALRKGELTVKDEVGHPIHNVFWAGHPHFGYSLALSVVRVPRTFSARRFLAAHIEEKPFDAWRATVESLVPTASPSRSPRDLCREYLNEIRRGERRMSRRGYLQEAQGRIPGLSERVFNVEWGLIVPKSWQEAGRIRRKNSQQT